MIYSNGVKFKGRFSNDERAEGKETHPDGTIYDAAKYKDDKKVEGSLLLPNGIKFTGKFVNDLLHGRV